MIKILPESYLANCAALVKTFCDTLTFPALKKMHSCIFCALFFCANKGTLQQTTSYKYVGSMVDWYPCTRLSLLNHQLYLFGNGNYAWGKGHLKPNHTGNLIKKWHLSGFKELDFDNNFPEKKLSLA